MNALRLAVCSLVATAGLLCTGATVSAQGLVGFYVYPDAYSRGLLISNFIPGSSAHELHLRGELYSGDVITRYDGQRVFSAAHVRAISSQAAPGQWLRMEFLTPDGQPFWHWVQPGGGTPVAAAPGQPVRRQRYHDFRIGHGRPGTGGDVPSFEDRPGRPGNESFPHGPGRPRY